MSTPEARNLRARVAHVDAAVDRAFDAVRGNAVADRVFYTASAVGDWSLVWHAIGWGRAVVDHDQLQAAVRLSVALGIESLLVNQGIKRLFRRARPLMDDHPHPHRVRRPSTSSFPSGHASSAAVAAVLLSSTSPAWTPLWVVLAVVVATSRIHVRAHHASDVVGGAIVGTVIGVAVLALWPL